MHTIYTPKRRTSSQLTVAHLYSSIVLHARSRCSYARAAHRCVVSRRGDSRGGAPRRQLRCVLVLAHPVAALRARSRRTTGHPRAGAQLRGRRTGRNDPGPVPGARLDPFRRRADGRGGSPSAGARQSAADRPTGRSERCLLTFGD